MSKIIKKPLLTEKNNALAEKGVYVFEVDRSANKTAIREHIERYFEVRVKSVRTLICRGRSRKTRSSIGRVPYWKKAVVRLVKGAKIDLFEGG